MAVEISTVPISLMDEHAIVALLISNITFPMNQGSQSIAVVAGCLVCESQGIPTYSISLMNDEVVAILISNITFRINQLKNEAFLHHYDTIDKLNHEVLNKIPYITQYKSDNERFEYIKWFCKFLVEPVLLILN